MKDNLKNKINQLSKGFDLNKWDNSAKEKIMEMFTNLAIIWSILDLEEVGDGGTALVCMVLLHVTK